MGWLKVTLDTQCINDLLERRDAASQLDEVLYYSSRGLVDIGIPAISGSENLPGYVRPETFDLFLDKLRSVGLSSTNLLLPPFYWDITFWDWALFPDAQMIELEKQLHAILFPYAPFDAPKTEDFEVASDYSKALGKWINKKCDVLVLWSHIHHGRDVLVTRDKNFSKETKLPELKKLGVGAVETPEQLAQRFR